MVDAQFSAHGVVIVRRVPVVITAELIHEYYGLPPMEDVDDTWPSKYNLGCALRREGAAGWNGQRLLRGDLHLESAFWNLFISASLKPSSHTGEIFKEASQILYAIQTGRYIDVAGFIRKEIRGCGRQTGTSIIFPCLITAMCARAGLVVDDTSRDDTTEPDTPLCLFTWNTQASVRGLPTIGEFAARKRRRGDDVGEEQDQQEEDQQAPLPAQQAYGDSMPGYQTDAGAGSSQQRPEWVEYMLTTMQGYVRSEVASLRTDMYSRFDAMQLSIDEIHRATVRPAQPSDPSPSHVSGAAPAFPDTAAPFSDFFTAPPGGDFFGPGSSQQRDDDC